MIIAAVGLTRCSCPAPALITPCTCEQNSIYCNWESDIDLFEIFVKLDQNLNKSEKHFDKFLLKNTAITEIKANTTKSIKFDEIHINGCSSLKQVDKNAFDGTNFITKQLIIENNPILSSTPNNSIFEILSSFPSIESIILYNNDLITEIPSNAFQPINGYQNNLKTLTFYGPFTKIGNNSYFNLDHLTWLGFFYAQIKSIPDNAFAFKKQIRCQTND